MLVSSLSACEHCCSILEGMVLGCGGGVGSFARFRELYILTVAAVAGAHFPPFPPLLVDHTDMRGQVEVMLQQGKKVTR